ncbi:bifunctional folylpolyglutamate synthase/dihydrofolate synthase [Paucilactobacillus kaifaensis]|uniref:bifunctional folylpolyglutamate synthase/dihydrofolate synthase n=1 Tax=Paucilactobacillus kaifaensis TaxID=2559921 RepID=UPI001CC5FF0F|nr:cyanophycin synthetase [Paucilactobacillus kaifaensis]
MNSYEELIKHMNHGMLAADDDRVALLKKILAKIGHPDQRYKVVHLAGTNGKGSTGSLISQLLTNAGNKVGHFASPALHDLKEQITINQQVISEADFIQVYDWIEQRLPDEIVAADLTIFEWFVLVMLQWFANQHVDWAVIEAGLGGRDDATNAISAPLLTVFTHIDLDHTKILGNTIKKIAYNKSQIIKRDTTVFIAPNQHADTIEVLKRTAVKNQACEVNEASQIKIKINSQSIGGSDLIVDSSYLKHVSVTLKMIGEFQVDNFKTVVSIYDWLLSHDFVSTSQALIDAALQVSIPGRMQVLQTNPVVILDGAHNPDAAQQLLNSLSDLFFDKHLIFVIGFLKDKNYQIMARQYEAVADHIFVVTPDNERRALSAKQIQQTLPQSQVVATVQQGVNAALKIAGIQSVIVVTGSFYVVKELTNR